MSHDFKEQCLFFCSKQSRDLRPALGFIAIGQRSLWLSSQASGTPQPHGHTPFTDPSSLARTTPAFKSEELCCPLLCVHVFSVLTGVTNGADLKQGYRRAKFKDGFTWCRKSGRPNHLALALAVVRLLLLVG